MGRGLKIRLTEGQVALNRVPWFGWLLQFYAPQPNKIRLQA
jgi:hypothetical protein